MPPNRDRYLNFNIRLPDDSVELLTGLEVWLELGLLSDFQVKLICRENLVCNLLPENVTVTESPANIAGQDAILAAELITQNNLNIFQIPSNIPENISENTSDELEPATTVNQGKKKPNATAGLANSLMAELSVRWLLFLGMFLVVVSSGLLAATQWERFPSTGQYGILLTYTLVFFGVSFWTGKQNNLRLTTQALLVVTQLLVPVNFWAMDGFALWQNPVGWLVISVAAIALVFVTLLIGNSRLFAASLPNRNLRLINILGLAFLHLGWKIPNFPLMAIYIGMVGTSILTLYQSSLVSQTQVYNTQTVQNQSTPNNPNIPKINLPLSVIIYSLALLLSRGIFVAGVNIYLLGLAIGICGWLISYLVLKSNREVLLNQKALLNQDVSNQSRPYPTLPWQSLGYLLLASGWAVSVFNEPLQALGVSLLGIWIFTIQLKLYSSKDDFFLIFLIGCQANFLAWRSLSSFWQVKAAQTVTFVTGNHLDRWTGWGLGLLPYLLILIIGSELLRKRKNRELADFAELTYLLFGSTLSIIAFANPGTRSLNLLCSTLILVGVTFVRYKSLPSGFNQVEVNQVEPNQSEANQFQSKQTKFQQTIIKPVYLTHIVAILTFCSFLNWIFPQFLSEYWGIVLLVLMVGEWFYSVGTGIWRESAWMMGFGLAAASFFMFSLSSNIKIEPITNHLIFQSPNYWTTAWLVTPLTLSAIATRSIELRKRINVVASVIGLGCLQLLTLPIPKVRLVGLGIGVILMFVNTNILPSPEFALITIGSALLFIYVWLGEQIPAFALDSSANYNFSNWSVVIAMTIFGLWITRKFLLSRSSNSRLEYYADATNKWAISLLTCQLFALTLHSVMVYQSLNPPGIIPIIAISITLLAILFRSWQEPHNWAFYSIGWCLELITAETLALSGKSTIKIAIANIALGIIAQSFGEWWKRKHNLQQLPQSFHVLPIIYALFSVVLRFDTFTSISGLYTFGVAIIFIGVGRRQQKLKPLLYLGIIGVSIAAYELLFYQMLQAQGGAYGDGLIAMAALGAIIMYSYRILTALLTKYLQLTPVEITSIAHFHWWWSSTLLAIAILFSPVEINLLTGVGTGVFLCRYAIFQGRNLSVPASSTSTDPISWKKRNTWVYFGLIEALLVAILLQDLPIGQFFIQHLQPWNAALSCILACVLYALPWQRWGWSKTPWQNASYILPLSVSALTWEIIHPTALLIIAGFYLLLAKLNGIFRLSYISLIFVDWSLFRWFQELQLSDRQWYVTVIGLSLLYLAQFDPDLKLPPAKKPRHYIRLLGSAIICGWATIFHQNGVIIPAIFSLIGIFSGLGLRIRAFLYVGTSTFLITAIYQMVFYSLRYSFLKWVIGLCVGVVLISIAANFENQRDRLTVFLRNTIDEFQTWD